MSEPGSLIRTLSGRQPARNFHSYVINEVGLAILSGKLPVGANLPNDSEMMDRFGVSRTVLREALKTLEAKGLVEARAKVGTRVLPQSRWNLYDRQVLSWAFEAGPTAAFRASFLGLRRLFEAEAAALAAQNREAEHLRQLHYWAKQRSLMTSQPESFALAEFEIHHAIAEASADPFLRAAGGLAEFGVALAVRDRLGPELEVPSEGLSGPKAALYLRLITAIEAGAGEEARAAMLAVIDGDQAFSGSDSAGSS